MRSVDVANPIYDVVFTYLMQDQRVARLLIGRITGLAVQSLTVSPRGTALRRTPEDPEHDLPLTLLRMTFAARVQTPAGSERQVLIEILKASAPTVIERFRRYLGLLIGSGDTILTHPSIGTAAVPIVTIYLLGFALDDLSDEAVIDVCPRVTERRTGRELAASHPLVEGIHHRSHIIQIPRLARRRRDELERLLAIFDQGLVKGNGRGDAHVLTIEEGEYPAECAFVLRQLREAMAEEGVRRNMEGRPAVSGLDPVGAAGGASRAPCRAGVAPAARAGDPPPAWPGTGCRVDRRGAGGGCGRGAARPVGVTVVRRRRRAWGRSGGSAQLPYGRRRHTGGQPPHLEGGCRAARRWLARRQNRRLPVVI